MLNHVPEILLSPLRLFLAMMGVGMLILILGIPSGAETPITIETLTQSLDSSNERERIRAARAIGTLKPFSPQVLSLLRKTLKDESEQVQYAGIKSIKKMGPSVIEIRDPLIQVLNSHTTPGWVRSKIPAALTTISPESVKVHEAILRRAQDNNENVLVRLMSMRAIERFLATSAHAQQTVESLVEDESPPIQAKALLLLGTLPDPDPKVWDELFEMAKGKYGGYRAISSGVSSAHMNPKSSALTLLVEKQKGERLIPMFLKDLNDPSQNNLLIATYLLRVLGPLGENAKRYVPMVTDILHHTPPSSSRPDINRTRMMLLVTLNFIDPLSSQVRKTLQDMKGQDPYNRDTIEFLLDCVTLKGDPERKYGVLCGDPKRYSTASSP